MTRSICVLAAAILLPYGFVPAQGANDDSASLMDALVELVRGLEEGPANPPGVLDGVDTRAPEVARIARTIREKRISLTVDRLDLAATVDILRQVSGVNFVVSPRAREAMRADKPTVTLSLRSLTIENALNLLALHCGDYRFAVRYGAVLLIHKEEQTAVRVTRLYPVQDLVRPRRDFAAPQLALTNESEKTK